MEKCKTKLVPKLVEKNENLRIKLFTKTLKKTDAKLKKAKTEEEKEKLLTRRRFNVALLRPFNKTEKKREKKVFETSLCNPGCKGTVFEEDFDLEKIVKKTCKKNCKGLHKVYKDMRKTLLKGKKKILDEDSFYHAFVDKKRKEKLKKDGALSGCAITVLDK